MTARVETHPATVVVHGTVLCPEVECVVIACDHDGCGAVYVHDGYDVGEATVAARERGWTSVRERDGCPLHPVACDDAAPDAARERGR